MLSENVTLLVVNLSSSTLSESSASESVSLADDGSPVNPHEPANMLIDKMADMYRSFFITDGIKVYKPCRPSRVVEGLHYGC